MIIRKPYAFLIKNFRKIHIFLLVLCAYIYYKNMQTRSFVGDFLSLGTYDAYNEPISRYINFLVIISLILIIGLSLLLVILLKHKNKPWKLYLVPVISYTLMFIIFIITINFFNGYTGTEGTTGIRAIRDLLFISALPQYIVIIILLIRILGVDLNKFNFRSDQEYLELDNADREEIEININVDKESFKRIFKRLKRNIGYFYQEHKFIINIIISIITLLIIGYSYYYIFIVHKSYSEGDIINTSGYSISINDSYYTDKNYNGKVISKVSNFVILDVTIKNNVNMRKINFNRFHIMNGIHDYSYTFKTYELDFQDLGKTYESKEIKNNETINLIMIFKVDKKLDKDKFVLYYQEFNDGKPYLRKIKLKMTDLSKIKKNKTITLNNELTMNVGKNKRDLIIDDVSFEDSSSYSYQMCESSGTCSINSETVNANRENKILKISFVSDYFEGKDLIDFSTKYGKINYIDTKGNNQSVDIKSVVTKDYLGKYVYISVPNAVVNSNDINLIYTVRNNQYVYKIK